MDLNQKRISYSEHPRLILRNLINKITKERPHTYEVSVYNCSLNVRQVEIQPGWLYNKRLEYKVLQLFSEDKNSYLEDTDNLVMHVFGEKHLPISKEFAEAIAERFPKISISVVLVNDDV